MKNMRKILAVMMLLLVTLPVTGITNGIAGECHSSERPVPMSVMQEDACPDHQIPGGSDSESDHFCHCTAMMSCVAVLLPDAALSGDVAPGGSSAIISPDQTPKGHLAGLTLPPPRKLI